MGEDKKGLGTEHKGGDGLKPQGPELQALHALCVATHTCNLSSCKMLAGKSVQGHSWLHREFELSVTLGHLRHCLTLYSSPSKNEKVLKNTLKL